MLIDSRRALVHKRRAQMTSTATAILSNGLGARTKNKKSCAAPARPSPAPMTKKSSRATSTSRLATTSDAQFSTARTPFSSASSHGKLSTTIALGAKTRKRKLSPKPAPISAAMPPLE
jgi:hypothetical protein